MTSSPSGRPSTSPLDVYARRSPQAERAVADIRRLCRLLPLHAAVRSPADDILPIGVMWRRVADTVAAMTESDPRADLLVKLGLVAAESAPHFGSHFDGEVRLAPHRLDGGTHARRALERNPARLLRLAVEHVDRCTELALDNEEQNPYGDPVFYGQRLTPAAHEWVESLAQMCDELPSEPRLFPLWRERELTAHQQADLLETLIVRSRREVLATAVEATERMVGRFVLEGSHYVILDADALPEAEQDYTADEVVIALGYRIINAVGSETGRGCSSDLERLCLAESAGQESGFDIAPAFAEQRAVLIEEVTAAFSSELGRRADSLPPAQWFGDAKARIERPGSDFGI